MSLLPGIRVGSCEVLGPLGAGGMGEVYRARDLKLQREVALKVLPDALADNPERRQRFEREAHLLAALNHPHIASIYGVVEDGDLTALMLELVPGETLAERLAQGPIQLAESLAIARQIADALDAAHNAGIVHRDLKPANIKLRPDGTVKVLDFGLAKAMSPSDSGVMAPEVTASPTALPPGTEAGIILGTAAYMAPEQARGKAVDKRADIWAFGVVLWEMLAGRPLFQGETISDTLAAVLTREVDWSRLPQSTPPAIVSLLKRCLERDPRTRLRDIGDARFESDLEPARAGASSRTRWPWVLAVVAALVVGVAIGWQLARPAPAAAPPEARFAIPLKEPTAVALSPDGQTLAAATSGPLVIRELGKIGERVLAGTEGAAKPFWSPDGRSIGYGQGGTLWRVSAAGGTPQVICDLPTATWDHDAAGAWQADDTIVFTNGGSNLIRVSAGGGDQTTVLATDLENELHFHGVSALPAGRGFVYVVHRSEGADTVEVFADGTRRRLWQAPEGVRDPVYIPSGHILVGRGPGLWAMPFDLERLELRGQPWLVEPGVSAFSASGTTVAFLPRITVRSRLKWLGVDGTPAEVFGEPAPSTPTPALSPDGTRVAIVQQVENDWGLWVHDLVRGTRTRLPGNARGDAAWHPDGRTVIYSTLVQNRLTLNRARTDGTPVEQLEPGQRPFIVDGRHLFFDRFEGSDSDVYVRDLTAGAPAVPFLAGPALDLAAVPSPDGRLIAYLSMTWRTAGSPEIMLRRFPAGDERWQVSASGGWWPRWSRDGTRIFYVTSEAMYEVAVRASAAGVELSRPRRLFSRPVPADAHGPDGFDVAADGRFLVLDREAPPRERMATIVLNWSPPRAGS